MTKQTSRLLSPAELKEAEEASSLLNSARQEAREICAAATDDAQRLEREACKRGEIRGIQELLRATAELRVERRLWLQEIAPQLVDVAIRAARAIIDEAAADGQLAVKAVRAQLDQLEAGPKLRVLVHCDDAEAVLGALQSEMQTGLQVVTTPNIARGGCIIDTERTLYDGRIETRIEQLREALSSGGGP